MANSISKRPEDISGVKRYVGGYTSQQIQAFSNRSVAQQGTFFLPHLRSGMSLLDCGCGPGAMTVELAQVVAPGKVVGIDLVRSPH